MNLSLISLDNTVKLIRIQLAHLSRGHKRKRVHSSQSISQLSHLTSQKSHIETFIARILRNLAGNLTRYNLHFQIIAKIHPQIRKFSLARIMLSYRGHKMFEYRRSTAPTTTTNKTRNQPSIFLHCTLLQIYTKSVQIQSICM